MGAVDGGQRVADVQAGNRARRAAQQVAARFGGRERDDRAVQATYVGGRPAYDR